MPLIADYLGLVFYIYFADHPPPHVHVHYGSHKLTIDLQKAELLVGYLPAKKRKQALKLVSKYQAELLEKWNEAQNGEVPKKMRVTL